MDDHDFGTSPIAEQRHNQQQQFEQGQTPRQEGERRVVSVVIDQDEDEDITEEGDLNTSTQSHEQIADPCEDHNYVVGMDHPKPSQNPHFPVIEGLTIDEKDDFSGGSPILAKGQQFYRPPMKRLSGGYGYDEFSGYGGPGNGYYRQQVKGAPGVPAKYVSVQQQSPFAQRQPMPKGERLPLTLRPAGRGRPSTTNLDNPYASGIRTTHSLPPPIQQHQRHPVEMDQEYFDAPAPMITASRGRQSAQKNKIGQRQGTEQQLQPRIGYGRGSGGGIPVNYTSPPPGDTHTYAQQRKPPPQKRQSAKSVQQLREQELEEQQKIYLEEEEQMNNEFFERQQGKLPTVAAKVRRPRSTKKATIAPSDPIQASQDQQDSSKPPDDPFLPPQQVPRIRTDSPQHSTFDSSALDGTINAVIRGEASVMQQHFGPPPSITTTSAGHHFGQIHHQQQIPTSYKIPVYRQTPGSRKQSAKTTSPQLSHQRLDELAELANASANLLEQTTSSIARSVSFQQQQQQQQYQQQFQGSQQTLHFKVVQTSHQEEPFQQDYRPQQQVFTIQQRTDQYAQHISALNAQQQQAVKPKKPRRSAPRRRTSGIESEEQQQKTDQIPGTSSATISEEQKEMATPSGTGKRRSAANKQKEAEEAGLMAEAPITPAGQEAPSGKKKPKKRGYTTRCICEMTHNDPFMIQCDRCDVWQHGLCMGISDKNVPDDYLCEQCNPRKLKNTPKQAANVQQRALKKLAIQKNTKKIAANLRRKSAPSRMKTWVPPTLKTQLAGIRSQMAKKPNRSPSLSNVTAIGALEQPEFEEITQNTYSRGVRSMVNKMQPFVLGEIGLLKRLEKISQARPMLVTPVHKGLVATQGKTTMPPGMPIMEYTGVVSLMSETRTPNKPINHDFTIIYNGFDESVVVDATKKGSNARYIRRSCRPNATIQHAIIEGKLRFYLYATTNIENSTEITIPFDFDYRQESTMPVECACGKNSTVFGQMSEDQEQYCPVAEFNKSLQQKGRNVGIALAPVARVQSPQRGNSSSRIGRQPSNTSMTAPKSPQKTALIQVKEEVKSPTPKELKVGSPAAEPDQGRQLRARIAPPKPAEESPSQTPPSHGRTTRRSTSNYAAATAANKEPEKEEEGGSAKTSMKRTHERKQPTSSIYTDFVETPEPAVNSSRSDPVIQNKTGDCGLANLVTAYRQKPPSTSMSPAPKKRGRPSNVAGSELKEVKKEVINATETAATSKMSREERKMQQTIAAYERAEQQKKRRQSEDQYAEVSPKKMRTEKQTPGPSSSTKKAVKHEDIWTELGQVLRQKLKGESEFQLPAEFDDLRAKLVKEQQEETPTKSPVKESPKRAAKPPAMAKINIRARQQPQHAAAAAMTSREAAMPPASMLRSIEAKKGEKSPPEKKQLTSTPSGAAEKEKEAKERAPVVQQQIEPETDHIAAETAPAALAEQSRMPNTKAHKKLTIEEYRKKRQAEIEAKQAVTGDGARSPYGSAVSTSFSAPPTRQSPRKSFIPTISSVPSPPQQLEDFAPSPPAIGGRQPQQYSTPSLDELKKRILTTSASSSSGAAGGSSRSAGTHEAHPPLPVDPLPPPPPPRGSRPSTERGTLDERLKRFVKRGT